MLGVLERRRHPVDAALEPADLQAGVAVEDPAEDVLAEHLAERRDVVQHADDDAVVLGTATPAGSRRCGAPPGGRSPRSPSHTGTSRCWRSRSGLPSSSLPGLERQQNVLRPSAFSSVERAPGALGVPPVDEPDAVEAAARALLHLGDVLVVDPEAELADLLVGPAQQRRASRWGRRAPCRCRPDSSSRSRASMSPVRGAGQRVVLRQHLDELAGQERLAADGRASSAPSSYKTRGAPGPSSTPGTARRRCPPPARCGRRPRTPRCRRAARLDAAA